MRKALTLFGIVISSTVLGACGDDSDGTEFRPTRMYWSAGFNENGVVRRANLDGSDLEDVVNVGTNVVGISADAVDAQVYWSTGFGVPVSSGKIQRAGLDGSGVEDVLTSLPFPYGVSIDRRRDKIYWTEFGTGVQNGKIRRANLDGSEVEDLITGQRDPAGVALDARRDTIYWVELGPIDETGAIWRARLDGSDAEELVGGIHFGEGGIAVDGQHGRVYWTTQTSGIQHAKTDGSDVHDIPTCDSAGGIALDVAAGKMYWTCFVERTIERANLDGSDEEHLVDDPEIPHFIALGPDAR